MCSEESLQQLFVVPGRFAVMKKCTKAQVLVYFLIKKTHGLPCLSQCFPSNHWGITNILDWRFHLSIELLLQRQWNVRPKKISVGQCLNTCCKAAQVFQLICTSNNPIKTMTLRTLFKFMLHFFLKKLSSVVNHEHGFPASRVDDGLFIFHIFFSVYVCCFLPGAKMSRPVLHERPAPAVEDPQQELHREEHVEGYAQAAEDAVMIVVVGTIHLAQERSSLPSRHLKLQQHHLDFCRFKHFVYIIYHMYREYTCIYGIFHLMNMKLRLRMSTIILAITSKKLLCNPT